MMSNKNKKKIKNMDGWIIHNKIKRKYVDLMQHVGMYIFLYFLCTSVSVKLILVLYDLFTFFQ